MKKVTQRYSKYYPILRLYRDDIEEIITVFQRNFDEFEIVLDNYQLTDISDIDKVKADKTSTFSVTHFHHYSKETPQRTEMLKVDFDKNSARLSLSNEDDVYLLGIATQLDQIISRSKCIQSYFTSGKINLPVIVILGCLSAIFFDILPWKFSDHSLQSILLMLLTFLPLLIAAVWPIFGVIIERKHTLIYLFSSSSKTNILSRNKDQIILALTVGIITAVITGVLTAYITSLIIQNHP